MWCHRPGVTQRNRAQPGCLHQHEPLQPQRRRDSPTPRASAAHVPAARSRYSPTSVISSLRMRPIVRLTEPEPRLFCTAASPPDRALDGRRRRNRSDALLAIGSSEPRRGYRTSPRAGDKGHERHSRPPSRSISASLWSFSSDRAPVCPLRSALFRLTSHEQLIWSDRASATRTTPEESPSSRPTASSIATPRMSVSAAGTT